MNKNKKIKAILLYAPEWCKMSREIRIPFIDECHKLHVNYEVLDVEQHDGLELSKKYGMRNPPAVLIFENNKLIGMERGKYCYQTIET